MNIVLKKLREVAKRGEQITYSDLARDCKISYNSIDERNNFHHILGEISKKEVKKGKPMISVLVYRKADIERSCGKGFFILVDELKQRKKNETDKELQWRITGECWK